MSFLVFDKCPKCGGKLHELTQLQPESPTYVCGACFSTFQRVTKLVVVNHDPYGIAAKQREDADGQVHEKAG